MADLYNRLRQLKEERAGRGDAPHGPPAGGAPACIGGSAGGAAARPLREMPPGPGWRRVAPGVFEREQVHQLPPGIAADVWTRRADGHRLAGGFSSPPGEALFLDVETSGLSGGAGSTAFLIGIGRLADGTSSGASSGIGGVRVTQLFLSEPSSEALMLERLHALLAEAGEFCWVTYNGGSFDLPVLRTRHILNRMQLPEHSHWDLLHITRRLWAPVIGPCNLAHVEDRVLGLSRLEDVPGSEVPGRYHRFIEDGDAASIAPVVSHHAYDVAHLASLALVLLEVVGGLSDEHSPGLPLRARPDELALVRLLLQRGDERDAERCVRLLESSIAATRERRRIAGAAARRGGFAARASASPPRAWAQARELRAVLARRRGETEREHALRQELCAERGARHDVVELAKVLEHRLKRPGEAARLIHDWAGRVGADLSTDAELAHRLTRLQRRSPI